MGHRIDTIELDIPKQRWATECTIKSYGGSFAPSRHAPEVLACGVGRAWCPGRRDINARLTWLKPMPDLGTHASRTWPPAPNGHAVRELHIGAKFDGHDSAVFIVDPKCGALHGLATERVTRYKHDPIFPLPALQRLVHNIRLDATSVDRVWCVNSFSTDADVVYSRSRQDDTLRLRRALDSRYAADFERKDIRFRDSSFLNRLARLSGTADGRLLMVSLAKRSLRLTPIVTLTSTIVETLQTVFPRATIDVRHRDHEYCHALAALNTSNFQASLVVALDGSGDNGVWSRAYVSEGNRLRHLATSRSNGRAALPGQRLTKLCSPGGIYALITRALGFRPNSDEGKTEALAAFGTVVRPLYEDLMSATTIAPRHLSVECDPVAVSAALERQLRGRSVIPDEDLAATVQRYLEDSVIAYLRQLVQWSGSNSMALAGGVFANVVLNLRIFEEVLERIHICPAMGDDGSAQGAAFASLREHGWTRESIGLLRTDGMPYYGTSYDRQTVRHVLDGYPGIRCADLGSRWPRQVGEWVHKQYSVAVFQGRMEWGPRALGNRSILVTATIPAAREVVNRLKGRPSFQPVCPAILASDRHIFFQNSYTNRHMTVAFRLRPALKDRFPSVAHVDGTARVQLVEREDNPALWTILHTVKTLSGYGVVLNTSFNLHGRTIVESPDDALQDYLESDIDILVIEGYAVVRQRQHDPRLEEVW
jgi:carbamoyltransferase